MKSYRKELWFNIPSRRGFVNITVQVEEALRESNTNATTPVVRRRHSKAPKPAANLKRNPIMP